MGIFSSSKKYEVSDIKKWYTDAEKNFNPVKFGSSNKEPSPKPFMSKIYFKFLALNYKSIAKLFNGKNKDYALMLERSAGDYSRRQGRFYEVTKETVARLNDLIRQDPDLKYTIVGAFKDTFESLTDRKWVSAFKLAFDYCNKTGDKKSIASGYKTLYYSLVIALEMMMGSIAEFQLVNDLKGESVIKTAVDIHYRLSKGFMEKIVLSAINLTTLMRLTQNPESYVKNLIKGEMNAAKSSEALSKILENDKEYKATEGLLQKAFVENKFLWTIAATGITAFSFAAGFSGVAGPLGIAWSTYMTVAFVVVLVFCIIPCTRHIIYFVSVAEVDMRKEAELNVELLANNIAILEEKRSATNNKNEQERLGEVIAKQKEYLNKMKEKLYRQTGNIEYAVDSELDKDDDGTNKEADENGVSTNTDGDPSEPNDEPTFELSI